MVKMTLKYGKRGGSSQERKEIWNMDEKGWGKNEERGGERMKKRRKKSERKTSKGRKGR